MAKLRVVRLGHPSLRTKSKPVSKKELATKKFQNFLDELIQACLKNEGVGIAAPQVNVTKRVIIVNVDPDNPRYPDKKPFPLTVVINPKVIKKSSVIANDWEGDLSCSLRALVPRPTSCEVVGLDRNGAKVSYDLKYSFHARVFQHEIDHLDGIFLLDKVERPETICEPAEYEKYWKNKEL